MVRALDLPPDVALDLPRLTLVGGVYLELENHRGLVKYSPHNVTVAYREGQLEVEGQDLVVDRLDEQVVVLSGEMASIRIIQDSGGEGR